MLITLVGQQSDSLCAEFAAAGLEFILHQPVAGDIRKFDETVDVIANSLDTVVAFALAFKSWTKVRRTRKVIITSKDNKIFHVDDLSLDELVHLLVVGKSCTAFDTRRPDNENVFAWAPGKTTAIG
jgi:hypothetical protein